MQMKYGFVIFFSDESILLDLKHLLMEAKQKVPPFLAEYASESEKYLDMGGMILLKIFLAILLVMICNAGIFI